MTSINELIENVVENMKVYCLSEEASLHSILGPWRILKLKHG